MSIVDWLEASYKRREASIMEAANKVLDELLFKLELVLAGYWEGKVFEGKDGL